MRRALLAAPVAVMAAFASPAEAAVPCDYDQVKPTVESLSCKVNEMQGQIAGLVRALQSGEKTGKFTIELQINPKMEGVPQQYRAIVEQFIRTNWQNGVRDVAFSKTVQGGSIYVYFADGTIKQRSQLRLRDDEMYPEDIMSVFSNLIRE